MELDAAITSGSFAAFISTTNTFQIFEADGTSPVTLMTAAPEPSCALMLIPTIPLFYFLRRRLSIRC